MSKTIIKRIEDGTIVLNDNPVLQNIIDIKTDAPKDQNNSYCANC